MFNFKNKKWRHISRVIFRKYNIDFRRLLLVTLLLSIAIRCFLSMHVKSPTFDEVGHLGAGYSYLKTNDYRLYQTNPPLLRQIAAFPLLFMDLKAPLDHKSWEKADATAFGTQLLYRSNVDADKIFFISRSLTVAMSVLLGFFVFLWSKELFGLNAGIFALFLYAFEPNILAHSRLISTDLGFTCLFFISLYFRGASPVKKLSYMDLFWS